jgi:hypothetical protein
VSRLAAFILYFMLFAAIGIPALTLLLSFVMTGG